jgi:hypothetical protein
MNRGYVVDTSNGLGFPSPLHREFRAAAKAILGLAVAAAAGLVTMATPANATVFTLNLTGSAASTTYGSFFSGGQHYNTAVLDVGTGSANGLPITVAAGDEVQINLLLDDPFTVLGATGYQFFGVNLIDSGGGDPTFLPSPPNPEATTGTVAFSGGTGALLGALSTNCGNCLTNLLGRPGPVAAFTFTSLYADLFIGDPTLAMPFTVNDVTISYQVNSAVPEPANWAMMLLGFGALGVAMRSRKRREVMA